MNDYERKTITTLDIGWVLLLLAIWPAAWMLPATHWSIMAGLLARALLFGRNREQRVATIARSLGVDAQTAATIDFQNSTNLLLRSFHVLRCYRPGNWHPHFVIEGSNHITDALTNKNAIILWIAPFRFHDLITKMALSRAGFKIIHVSMTGHGWSTSQFGIKWLNPIWIRMENNFIKERFEIGISNRKSAMRELGLRLSQDSIVAIAAVKGASRRPGVITLFDACYEIGLGAPILAYETGATLVPVFTFRRGGAEFALNIGAPIKIQREIPRIEAALEAAKTFGHLLEGQIASAPSQWYWGREV